MELTVFPGKTLPKPPNHLKAAGRRLWAAIVTQYRIADGAGLALVTTAAEAQDRIREAQRAIRQYGALVPDRYGALKQNPACFLERDARAGMRAARRRAGTGVPQAFTAGTWRGGRLPAPARTGPPAGPRPHTAPRSGCR